MTEEQQNRFWRMLKIFIRIFMMILHDIVTLLMALVYGIMLYYLLTTGAAH